MKRIAIIGATGAIGTALLQKCIEQNIESYVFVQSDSKRRNRIPQNELIHVITCGMENLQTFDSDCIPEIDVFYQFAWEGTYGADARNDMNVQISNIKYTLDAVHTAYQMKCRKFVFAGSQAEYGRVDGILKPETACKPENGYGVAKYCAEIMSKVECQKLGMEHVTGRILSVYGPGDGENSMVSCAISRCLDGENPMFTMGEQKWDYLFNEDAADAFFRIGECGKNGSVYVVGSGQTKTLREYISIICETANPSVVPLFGRIPYMDKQVMFLQADIASLREDTGFEPKIGFEEGIQRTVQWMKKQRVIT